MPIDFAMEDANFRVKHGNFEKGLPTFERIVKFVLAGDRVTGKVKFGEIVSKAIDDEWYSLHNGYKK